MLYLPPGTRAWFPTGKGGRCMIDVPTKVVTEVERILFPNHMLKSTRESAVLFSVSGLCTILWK